MESDLVLFEKKGPVGLATVNRPEAKNALNMAVFRELSAVLDQVKSDEGLRVLVVTGAGNAFVAGADIKELLSYSTQEGWAASRAHQSILNKLERLGMPAIAAINGFAMGGGLEIALSCTFRVASAKARMGFPELGWASFQPSGAPRGS